MVTVTCYGCKRRFNVTEQEIADGLARLEKANPRFYVVRCPACQATNKISLKRLRLPAPTPPVEEAGPEGDSGTPPGEK
jgi:hypothetical protein